MAAEIELPSDVELVRTTPELTATTTPPALRRAHRVATGTWGRLRVHAGSVQFRFEDDSTERTVRVGEEQVIPPDRPHAVEPDDAARFVVEFLRPR